MKLRFSTEAKNDLLRIGDHIAQANPLRALTVLRDLRAKSSQLVDRPLAFALVPRFEHLGIRRRVVGKYLVLYRVDEDAVSIIHVLHGAQNDDSWLEEIE